MFVQNSAVELSNKLWEHNVQINTICLYYRNPIQRYKWPRKPWLWTQS